MRRIASHYALLPSGITPRPIVSLNDEGVITGVSVWENLDSLSGVEFYAGLLIPGMVNAHCHLELSAMEGCIPAGGRGLAAFAREMGGIQRDVPSRDKAISAQDAIMWQEGISAVADICNGDSTFAVKSRSLIAYLNMLELFGLNASSASQLDALAQKAESEGLRYGITPHSTYSLQTAAFAQAVEAAGRGYSPASPPLSIHFMESPDEGSLYCGLGGLSEWYADRGFPAIDFATFCSPARRIISQVPADREIMLVHNTFITEEDIDLLTAHFGERVTYVLCLRSNIYISGLLPPVGLLRRKGVRIAVGTDSLASNSSLSVVEELRQFTGIPLPELLQWATTNGARALGLGDRFGALETGKAPGIVLISGMDMENLELTPQSAARRLA